MDNPAHLDPSQELPPPPEEKLLRAPTFWEKNAGKINWLLLILVIIVLSVGGSYVYSEYKYRQDRNHKSFDGEMCGGLAPNPCGWGYTCIYPPNASLGHCRKEGSLQPTTAPVSTEAPTQSSTPSKILCTMEAKQCPDGSYVGRTGPKCEFVCKK